MHVIAFIAHQYYRLQDNLVDVLLTSLQSFQNGLQKLAWIAYRDSGVLDPIQLLFDGLPQHRIVDDAKEDQEMAESCKRLIKNCIICWNYLFLLEETEDAASRQAFRDAVAHGSAISWQHINVSCSFSSEKSYSPSNDMVMNIPALKNRKEDTLFRNHLC